MYRSGKRWGNEIKRGMGDVGLDVDADTSKARAEVKELEREIDKPHKIKIEHDKSSFAAAATAARNLEQNFQTVAIAAAAVPNTIASVGTAATQLSGVIGLMPATVGAAALAFGSLKVATMGFGDALKEVRDPVKFAEAIAQLAPNAQGAARAIEGLMPQITQLKMTVQDAFFAGFGDQIKQLGSTYLPMFQGVMSQMAGSAGTALRSVSQMLTTPAMAGDMSAMTGNMSSAFNILSQALAPVVKAFMDIGVVGSGFLPALAAAATEAANAFAVFIDKARSTGDLQEWIQTGINAFKQLMDIVGNVGSIIGGIMKAAPEGGGLLGMLQDITQTLADFVNSPAGQGAFSAFMSAMSQTIAALMPVLGSFLTAIAPILGILGQLAATVITSLAPAFTQLFTQLTPVVQAFVSGLQPVVAQLGPVLQQLAAVLVTSMLQGFQQILPLVGPLVGAFANWLQAVLPLLPSLMQLALNAMPAFQAVLSAVLPILTVVLNVMADIANRVVPLLSGAIGALAGTFTDRWNAISGAVSYAWTVMSPIFNLIIDGVGKVMAALDRISNNPLARAVLGVFGGTAGNILATPAPSGANAPASTLALPGLTPGSTVPRGTAGAVPKPGTNEWWIPPGPGSYSHGDLGYSTRTPPALAPGSAFPAAPMPPPSSYVPPAPSSGGGGGGGNTPAALSPTGVDWDKIAQAESAGNWAINTDNGYYGGLQFDLPTWQQFGGTDFAERPDLASREQQIEVAERVPVAERAKRWPNTYSKGAAGRPPAGSGSSSYTPNGYTSAAAAPTAQVTGASGLLPAASSLASMVSQNFPEIARIGGVRDDAHPDHPSGRALDIMIPGGTTRGGANPSGKAYGDQIWNYLMSTGIVDPQGSLWQTDTGGDHFDHIHARIAEGMENAAVSGGVTPYGLGDSYSGDYSSDKSVREAQQKVQDTKDRIADEEARLQEMRMTPGTTPADIAKQERDVAKARREHADALADLTEAQNKFNSAASEQGDGGFSGENFMAGIAEFFGFDGSLFKNPAEFGLMKFFGAASKLRPSESGGGAAASAMGGEGGGGLGGLLSLVSQPFGQLGVVPDRNAPGQFMPLMPNESNAGGVISRAFAPAGAPGPGNQIDNSININNPVGSDQFREGFQMAQSEQFPRMRQPLRHVPQ